MARDKFISVNEAARLKGCSRQTIHHAIAKGNLLYTTERAVVYKVSVNSLAKLRLNDNMKRAGRPRRSGRLEDDGLLTVEHPPQGSLSFQADYFARQHPTTETGDIRDFFALTERYYQKLLARFYPGYD